MPPKEIKRVAKEVGNGESTTSVTVRTLLSWYEARRRGYHIVDRINQDFYEFGITTTPDFESVWLDDTIVFVPNNPKGDTSVNGQTQQSSEIEPEKKAQRQAGQAHLVSQLESARNRNLISVKPNDSLSLAVTKMQLNDFSQLPVMINIRDLKGVVTWTSIGSHLVHSGRGNTVQDMMVDAIVVSASATLFDAITLVARHDFVLVRQKDQTISGIITATDIADRFKALSEPFLLINEIETRLRHLLEPVFENLDRSKAVKDGADGKSAPMEFKELTFGGYQSLLAYEPNWEKVGLALDRAYFCGRLDRVRQIRNDVMHFNTDDPDPDDLRLLREFNEALSKVLSKY